MALKVSTTVTQRVHMIAILPGSFMRVMCNVVTLNRLIGLMDLRLAK